MFLGWTDSKKAHVSSPCYIHSVNMCVSVYRAWPDWLFSNAHIIFLINAHWAYFCLRKWHECINVKDCAYRKDFESFLPVSVPNLVKSLNSVKESACCQHFSCIFAQRHHIWHNNLFLWVSHFSCLWHATRFCFGPLRFIAAPFLAHIEHFKDVNSAVCLFRTQVTDIL